MNKIIILVAVFLIVGCKSDKKYYDLVLESIVVQDTTQKVKSIVDFQYKLNAKYKNAKESPLTDKDRKEFESLDFFIIDTSYIVNAKFELTPDELPFLMPTTTDRLPEYKKFGIAYFTLKGQDFKLNIYQNQQLKEQEEYRDYLFLPFTDLTNGETSYGGGRYIDMSIPDGDHIIIDFNKAYNPYCTYNKKYSCPRVPSENDLNIEIPTGVKAFK